MMATSDESKASFKSNGMLNEKQLKILEYIDSKIKNVGYIKSKHASENIEELSSKEVGTNMPMISRNCSQFIIEEWSTSASNTWRVERKHSS